jgi:hypothetical protein
VELREAIDKANQILDEERSSPTVQYSLRLGATKPEGSFAEAMETLRLLAVPQQLEVIRSQRPRRIEEDPRKWGFKSVNYNLLCALLSRMPGDWRPAFCGAVLTRLNSSPGCSKSESGIQPSWRGYVSEFPLVAEFCVRSGDKRGLLQTLFTARPTVGLAVMLRHIEDMIALNFTVFEEADYKMLATAVSTLREAARKECAGNAALRTPIGEPGLHAETIAATGAIGEECRKALYLYLKGVLLEGFNLELNQDKEAVESHLKRQGFSDALIGCLEHVDRIYQSASSGFDFKACMAHLRSFMEKLHSEGLGKLHTEGPDPTTQKWGDGLRQLQQKGVLTKAEEGYAAALYTLLSDQGVHPVIAEKEYARLARNVVIEYGLLFLRKLEKSGLDRAKAGLNP